MDEQIMGSNSKLRNISHEDIISNLPDPLLLKILSFLPTESAVSTSALSKRWKPLCMYLPNLDLNYLIGPNYKLKKQSFFNFLDRSLRLREHDLTIERFSLKCSGNQDLTRVDEWLRILVEHNVKEINLFFRFKKVYELVRDVYVGRSLEVLRLKCKILVNVPEDVSFSRLKILEFFWVKFPSYESVEKLLLNCPVLEDLVIDNCESFSGCCLSVSGSALKNLSIFSYLRRLGEVKIKILIDTPALQTLKIKVCTSECILIKENLPSLTTANIDILVEPRREYGDSVFELLNKIYHVKCLILSENTLAALHCASDYRFPTFHTLTELELLVDGRAGWTLLPDILISSPNLRSLVFPQGLVDRSSIQSPSVFFSWSPAQLVPDCLSSHLETIEIRKFLGIEEEFSLVKYLLEHGGALRKILIDCSLLPKESEVPKKLLKYRRGSKACKIDLIF